MVYPNSGAAQVELALSILSYVIFIADEGSIVTDPLVEQDVGRNSADVDYRLISRLAISYMMTMIAEVMRARRADYMDLLIVTAVFNANGEAGRGVSRNAVSRMLNVPLETVRRRVKALIERKTLAEQHDGLVFAYGDDPQSSGHTALDELNFEQLRQLFRALKERGVEFD
jgi:hypothetical protein